MSALSDVLRQAGPVGVALVGVSFLLWWVVALRFFAIAQAGRFLSPSSARVAPGRPQRAKAADVEQRLVAWKNVLRAMVASAPLLGLLGTVGGMIETFATLHTSGLAHADASVAGGISTALLTTQLGLLLSVPGLLVARGLDRFEERKRVRLRPFLKSASGGAPSIGRGGEA